MRVLTVKLSYIYDWTGDSEEVKENKNKLREERRQRLEKIGITDFYNMDVSQPVIAMSEKQYIDLLALREEAGELMAITEVGGTVDSAIDKINELCTKLERFADRVGNTQFNEKVEVYTPGMGLLSFNRVMLLEDACSDNLQSHIDAGWNIIAACPQPNQRRPDYILGRYDPKNAEQLAENGRMASRG